MRSEGQYARLKLYYLLYTIAWCAVVTWVFLIWDTKFGWKAPIVVILVMVTPSLSDLFRPYSVYKELWETSNNSSEIEMDSGTKIP